MLIPNVYELENTKAYRRRWIKMNIFIWEHTSQIQGLIRRNIPHKSECFNDILTMWRLIEEYENSYG